MKDRIFIDSNIFLYAFSDLDNKKRAIASKIIAQKNIISTQVVNEVSSNLIKKLKFNNDEIYKFIESCYNRYIVENIEQKTFLNACKFRDKYHLSYYDSLIVSSAVLSGCDILYSEDMQDGLLIDERLMIINPFRNDK